ncbi:hypothetical protein BGZ98_007685 [Dissophora globulifera]|nr:hypothetical protein BGZ98_007685 [Dissophora globulifera]
MSQYSYDKKLDGGGGALNSSPYPPPVQEGQGYAPPMAPADSIGGSGQPGYGYGYGYDFGGGPQGASAAYGGGPVYAAPPPLLVQPNMAGIEQSKWLGGAAPPMVMASAGGAYYPGAANQLPTVFLDPTMPRPNDILPLHPAIIEQRRIAASLPPCPIGGYHELRKRHALGVNVGTFMSLACFPIVCCCVRNETVCIKCGEKFDIDLPRIN